MHLTFVNDLGQSSVVEIDGQMELENVMALLEAEAGIPVSEQSIHYEGRELTDPKRSMQDYGVRDQSMLLLRRKVTVGGRTIEHDAEMMRLQLLGDPEMLRRIQEVQPDLAAAAQSDPARFATLLRETQERARAAEEARAHDETLLSADPFDVEAQRRIEEAIRQQAVLDNMEQALEYSPESFGRVIMLYIDVEVNGHPVKAFVDSGAQQTILSPECAEQCGLMRLLDTRFSGIARGVGTAKILGRIHSAPMQVAGLHLGCAYTVMEGRDVDLLFGLDMLKAHQAVIDLEKGCLRIRGREIRFLSEHELPDKARVFEAPSDEPVSGGSSGPGQSQAGPSHFPGSGNTIGAPPMGAPAPPPAHAGTAQPQGGTRHPESAIATLMGLGATREIAIQSLDAADGNLDVAASLLF